MRTIWKYEIPIKDYFNHDMPAGAIFRSCGWYPQIAMWFEVNTEAPKVERHFRLFGTGHPIPYPGKEESDPPMTYLGTIFVGLLVFHIYEDVRES